MDTIAELETLPAWLVMWLLAAGLFFLGKVMALQRSEAADLGVMRQLAFVFLWVGMDVRPWRRNAVPRQRHSQTGMFRALLAISAGAILLWAGAREFTTPLAQGWCGMVGLILLLHFGSFALLAIFWNALGVPVVPIMNQPTRAVTLADFWGHRWNRAFRDLAHPLIFRPVLRRHGDKAALWAGFAVSGLVHELVISVPAGAGYGLPMSYFLLQAAGILWQRNVNATAPQSWLFTHAFTVLPAFLLFHPPFVERVMLPFFNQIGALPCIPC